MKTSVTEASVMKSVRHLLRRGVVAGSAGALALAASCTVNEPLEETTRTFRVVVTAVEGADLPSVDAPLPANIGDRNEAWDIEIQAIGPDGQPIAFDGVVRLSVEPGAVSAVEASTGEDLGRNLRIEGGQANARVLVTAMHGPSRLWVEDLGYVPAQPGSTPACANGVNDDAEEDVFTDFPNDPGCAFADDDTETEGTFAAGVSPEVHYQFPTVADVQGVGSSTPFSYEALQILSSQPNELIVTRIAKDGFYVTDVGDAGGEYNHIFAFSFSTPPGMRVCDRVTFLSGTVVEFFGFTEVTFPSYRVEPLFKGDEENCRVPEPVVLDGVLIPDAVAMEKIESALVRVEGYSVAAKFGPKPALQNVFAADQSNCDLNGDGRVDFESDAEASCGNACSADPQCSEWTSYLSRGNYKVSNGSSVIQVQTDGAPQFNPTAHRGEVLTAVTGSLRNFSGGSLNWTIETRCTDDLVCAYTGCSEAIKSSKEACVSLRTIDDNEEGTN